MGFSIFRLAAGIHSNNIAGCFLLKAGKSKIE